MKPTDLVDTDQGLQAGALDRATLLGQRARPISGLAQSSATAALVVHDILMLRRLECVLDLAPEGEADVLVVDLPDGEALPDPATASGAARLVLSDDPALLNDATLAGVLPRGASSRQIAAAVAAVAEGLTIRERRRETAPAKESAVPPGVLTPREAEILNLIGRGMSNKAIARFLGISAHTVKYHLEAVFAKLGVRSRAEAATQGMLRGFVVL